ncbi:MAG: chaplin [Actinomycetota bacterium]
MKNIRRVAIATAAAAALMIPAAGAASAIYIPDSDGSIEQSADGEMAITVMPLAAPEADGDLVAVPAMLDDVPAGFDDQVRQTLQSFPWLNN